MITIKRADLEKLLDLRDALTQAQVFASHADATKEDFQILRNAEREYAAFYAKVTRPE
jgi:hypothetical protein